MAKAAVRATSIKTLRKQIERQMLVRMDQEMTHGDLEAVKSWLDLLNAFQVYASGATGSSSATAGNVSGPQAALPGIEG